MENFEYQCETKLIFGKGQETKITELLKGKKVLLHYGKSSIKKSGLYDRIIKLLDNYIELPGVVPNPRIELVNEGIEICRKNNIDIILAVGGGSVIDSAKAIAAGIYYDGDVWDFFIKNINIEKALPIGVILTIPAAGSEASPNSVINNKDRKLAIGSNLIRPKFAILDPELTKTLPDYQTACGICDMIAHILERYFTNTKNVNLTDELCEATLRSIIKNARLTFKDPIDYNARAEIMLAGTIAHNGSLGLGREEDWSSHMIEMELSAYYDIAHGAGLSIVFPAWMKFVYKHDEERFKRFAKNVFNKETELEGIQALEDFFKEINLPTRLKEINIDDEKFELMAKGAINTGKGFKFIKLTEKDVVEIYRLALE
jgi:alcohol dehydrogenase YqhD (iron-dependent ADH family)